jgi:two-component system, cell cycle sensor histidine kinase and response regulator CckA
MARSLISMIDVPRLQRILDRFVRISGVSPAIMDADGNLILASGWVEICTRFHRNCPAAEARCKASNADITAEICRTRKSAGRCCANGLWDYAWPLFAGDTYLGSLWVGQFFHEPPDEARFRAQARELGFDEEAYVAAVGKVPLVTQERVRDILDFFEEMAAMLTGSAAERMRMAESTRRLESSEQRYAALADALPDAVYITDRDGDAIYVNRAAAKMLGRAPEDVIGRPQTEIFPHSADRHRLAIQRVFDTGLPLDRTPVKETTPHGDVWIDVHLVPLKDDDGLVKGVMGISRNITEQVLAEQNLRRSEQTYRTLVENSDDLIFRMDTDLRLVHVNRAVLNLAATTADAVIGRTLQEIVPSLADVQAFVELLRQVVATGEPARGQKDLVRSEGGRTVHVDFSVIPEFDDAGRVESVMAVARDITALRQAQGAMVRSQQLAAVGTLASGIAHEFNNIHTIALGQLEYVLRGGKLNDADREVIETTRSAVMRAVKVTRNILAFAHGGRAERQVVSLGTVVSDTVQFVRRSFEAEGIQIVLSEGPAPNLFVDASQISQVLMNLIINAHHATVMSEVKRIDLETGTADGRVFVRVRDTGCGIPKEDLDKVTLPFFSTKGEHARPGSPLANVRGIGLGLSVSDTLLKLNGGVMSIDSVVGRGTSVTVSFAPADGTERQERPQSVKPIEKRALRVLVVDDEPLILSLFERFLEDEGHSVTITDDGEVALRMLASADSPFDAIIVDVQMPKMNGLEIIGRLQAVSLARRPAILICTGQVGDDPPDLAALGVAAVLRKPLNMTGVAAAVQAAVQNATETKGAQ